MNILVSKFLDSLINTIPIIKREKLPPRLEDTLEKMVEHGVYLDRERINILLSFWHLPPISNHFYTHYFGDVITTEAQVKTGVEKFIKDALWYYGDLENAFFDLLKAEDIVACLSRHNFDTKEFEKRSKWDVMEPIDPKQRGYLGYVSGERPYRQKKILNGIESIIETFEKYYDEIKAKSPTEISVFYP